MDDIDKRLEHEQLRNKQQSKENFANDLTSADRKEFNVAKRCINDIKQVRVSVGGKVLKDTGKEVAEMEDLLKQTEHLYDQAEQQGNQVAMKELKNIAIQISELRNKQGTVLFGNSAFKKGVSELTNKIDKVATSHNYQGVYGDSRERSVIKRLVSEKNFPLKTVDIHGLGNSPKQNSEKKTPKAK